MAKELTYNEMTNAELNLKLKELENEYEATKVKLSHLVKHMEELDKKYIKVKETLNKRGKGVFA